ncbi:MAG TPA: RMD1 family protein [Desulfomonilia bacterium]|nr:RMD1 family protein [Desulfomonilia bacterium]
MEDDLFPGRKSIKVRAMCIGERIDLRTLEMGRRMAVAPLVLAVGDHGYATLFRYGVVVLFGLDPVEEVNFVGQIKPFVGDPYDKPQTEDLEVRLDQQREGIYENGVLHVRRFNVDYIQFVADALAKSVVLAHYEIGVATAFDLIEPLAADLNKGRGARQSSELMRYIGSTLLIQQRMVGRVEVAEKPDILWDQPDLERLYIRLQNEYELKERHLALERKLSLIAQTAETLLDILRNKRSLRVEWYIVILIILEILLTLYQMFVK